MKTITFIALFFLSVVAFSEDTPHVSFQERYNVFNAVLETYGTTLQTALDAKSAALTQPEWKEAVYRYAYAVAQLDTVQFSVGLCQLTDQSYCSDAEKTLDIVKFEINKLSTFYEKVINAKKDTGSDQEATQPGS